MSGTISCFADRLACRKQRLRGKAAILAWRLARRMTAGKKKARALRPGLPGHREPALSMLMTDSHPGGPRSSNRTRPYSARRNERFLAFRLHCGSIVDGRCILQRRPGSGPRIFRAETVQKCGISHNLRVFSGFFHDLRRSQASQRWCQREKSPGFRSGARMVAKAFWRGIIYLNPHMFGGKRHHLRHCRRCCRRNSRLASLRLGHESQNERKFVICRLSMVIHMTVFLVQLFAVFCHFLRGRGERLSCFGEIGWTGTGVICSPGIGMTSAGCIGAILMNARPV